MSLTSPAQSRWAAANGVIVIDKSRGPTSFDVVAAIRRLSGHRRIGHTGTLDPMATGVLPICVGEATKLVPFLMAGEKVYRAEARLGMTTDSGDATGRVLVEKDSSRIARHQVESELQKMVGVIQQRPPMLSAIRVGGRRLYELAREGKEVKRESRSVVVSELVLDEFKPGVESVVQFTVRCGKGTYVRTLAEDLGQRLEVGAHLISLRRLQVGALDIAQAVSLDHIAVDPILIGAAEALKHLPQIRLAPTDERAVRDGKSHVVAALKSPARAIPGDDPFYVRLLRNDGSLLAVAEEVGGRLSLVRVFNSN